jgi:hypothetical protein
MHLARWVGGTSIALGAASAFLLLPASQARPAGASAHLAPTASALAPAHNANDAIELARLVAEANDLTHTLAVARVSVLSSSRTLAGHLGAHLAAVQRQLSEEAAALRQRSAALSAEGAALEHEAARLRASQQAFAPVTASQAVPGHDHALNNSDGGDS